MKPLRESASATFKSMLFFGKENFKENAKTCKGYFKDGCSYPFCDMCSLNTIDPNKHTNKKGN